MSNATQVAVFTGGASGIGLAVAEALNSRKGWVLYLLDRDLDRVQAAAGSLGANFYQVDLTDHSSLAAAFKAIFQAHKKLNFVFANAGIAMHTDYYKVHGTAGDSEPPPAPDMLMINVNLHSVIATSYLAQHYFRQSPVSSGSRSLVLTASSAGLYASPMSPDYCASKHGVIGWARSVAPRAWRQDHVRVNAICPGLVQTNILPAEVFGMFPEQLLTPVSKVVEVVLMLLDGNDTNSSASGPLFGETVEISGVSHYFRKQPDYCDSTMEALMVATDMSE